MGVAVPSGGCGPGKAAPLGPTKRVRPRDTGASCVESPESVERASRRDRPRCPRPRLHSALFISGGRPRLLRRVLTSFTKRGIINADGRRGPIIGQLRSASLGSQLFFSNSCCLSPRLIRDNVSPTDSQRSERGGWRAKPLQLCQGGCEMRSKESWGKLREHTERSCCCAN